MTTQPKVSLFSMMMNGLSADQVRAERALQEKARQAKRLPPPPDNTHRPAACVSAQLKALGGPGRAPIYRERVGRLQFLLKCIYAGYMARYLLHAMMEAEYPGIAVRTINHDLKSLISLGLVHEWKKIYLIPAFYHNAKSSFWPLQDLIEREKGPLPDDGPLPDGEDGEWA